MICGGKQRNQSALLEGRPEDKKKSSRSRKLGLRAQQPLNEERWEVSTSGLSRDGLSSCCCCRKLVQKKEKVMEGRRSPEDTQTQGKVHPANAADLKMQACFTTSQSIKTDVNL